MVEEGKKTYVCNLQKKFPYMCAMCALTNGQLTERTMGSNGGVHVGPN